MKSNGQFRPQCYIGIDLGGTRIKAASVKFTHFRCNAGRFSRYHILSREEAPSPRHLGGEAILYEAIRIVNRVCSSSPEKPSGIGICCPGTVDPKRGTLIYAPLFERWRNVPIGKALKAELGLAVLMENDANAAALGEALWGAARDVDNSVYITVSTGLGVGIIIDGRIWRGTHGIAGELSHIPFSSRRERCMSKHAGCAEAFATGLAISERAGKLMDCAVSTRQVFLLASEGDSVARRIVEDAVRTLALIVAFAQTTIDPQVIVLGGGVVTGQSGLLTRIASTYSQIIDYPCLVPNLRTALLGDDASLMGAASLWLCS
jgi:glucokinase